MIGFDNYPINHQLLLSLPFEEMTGAITHDIAKPHHELTLSGTPATWHSLASGFPYITFDGVADFLECPAVDSADLNFVAGDFSLVTWINASPGGSDIIMAQGVVDVDGWEVYVAAGVNTYALRTNQGGAHTEISAVGAFTPNAWQLVGVTRCGASGHFYTQGEPATTTGSLIDPVSVAAGDRFLVGAHDLLGLSNFLNGSLALPRVWDRELTAIGMKAMFAVERGWFNV